MSDFDIQIMKNSKDNVLTIYSILGIAGSIYVSYGRYLPTYFSKLYLFSIYFVSLVVSMELLFPSTYYFATFSGA